MGADDPGEASSISPVGDGNRWDVSGNGDDHSSSKPVSSVWVVCFLQA